jgi:hypothetical protein
MSKQTCFVIMPFSTTKKRLGHTKDYWTNHYKNFLKPTIESTGLYDAHRSSALTGDIVKQIIYDLIKSELVVADLTDANSNVYWELGIRQSFQTGTITIAEEGTPLPFDLSRKGTHFYNQKGDLENANFIEGFREAICSVSKNECGMDSEVIEAVSGRGTLFEIMHKYETIRRVDALIEENLENKNFLEAMGEALRKQVKVPIGYSSLQSCSLELLLTQRYLEENQDFYSYARHVYLVILTINSAFSQYKNDWNRLHQFFREDGLIQLQEKFVDFDKKLGDVIKRVKEIK